MSPTLEQNPNLSQGHVQLEQPIAPTSERELARRAVALAMLSSITETISTLTGLDQALATASETIAQMMSASSVSIGDIDRDNSTRRLLDVYRMQRNATCAPIRIYPLAGHVLTAHILEATQPYLAVLPAEQHVPEFVGDCAGEQQVIVAPLVQKSEVLGLLLIGASGDGPMYDDADLQLAAMVAGQLAGAIENTRLYAEEQRQRQIAESLRHTAAVITRSLDQGSVLQAIMNEVQKVIACNSAGLSLYDNGELEIAAGINLSKPMGRRIPLDSTNPAARVFTQNRTIVIADLHAEPDFSTWDPNPIIRAWIGTPLRIGSLVIGMLGVDSCQVGAYTAQDIGVLEAFANQAAIAIENTRLFSQARLAWFAAEAASRAKSEFLSNISHELRTPLNGVLGYAQVLQRDTQLSDNQTTALHIIQRSGEHLLALLNDILDLGAVEANRLALTISAIDLQDFLYVVLGMVRARAEERGLLLSFHASPHLPAVVTSDEKRLRQVLLNLLGNAIKFTNQGSVSLHVSALTPSSSMRQMIRFEVLDTGSGIDPADLSRIFEPFEQGHTDRKIDGVGLGLPISRRLLALMDSELRVESVLGQGSRFWFDLPVSVTANSIQHALPAPRVIGYTGRRRTILVIDDQAVNCAVLFDMLTPLGFSVRTTTSAHAGLAIARELLPDCVLTDLVMPDMNGGDLARAIHAMPGLESCVVIAVSARIADREHLSGDGCADLVPKPVDERVLLTTLARHLQFELECEAVQADASETRPIPIPPPPMDQLAPLIHHARRGDMFALADAAAVLAQNPAYQAFARYVEQLAREYRDVQVLDALLRASTHD